jgi:ketosteroid isomerase-like protein
MPTTISVHKNVETIRRGYDAFNKGDMKTLTELFHENASWHVPGRSPLSGDYQGRDAVFAFFGRIGQESGGTFKAELRHVLVDDDGRVAGIEHLSAQRGGKRLSADACLVFEFKDGRVISGTEYVRDLYPFDQFWS